MATWLHGEHTLPSSITKSGEAERYKPVYTKTGMLDNSKSIIKPGTKVPAVIYMHGCAGISNEAYNYKNIMLSQGYAFFMPDSFARPGREKLCGKGGMNERVTMRQREVSTALKELRKMTWIDQKKIILMGFSEGGNTTDSWYNDDFTALIVLGSACTNSGGSPSAPANVPVLAIVGEHDDYRPGMSCSITRTIGGSQSIIIKGANHWISHYDETKKAINQFLKTCCG
ncbi:MAG: dienelactone hydrolase family protein [Gammaproteobacteria bacterium]|nr:dienelactone hydrolase family protein [Gammaproteobacteria bacterium]